MHALPKTARCRSLSGTWKLFRSGNRRSKRRGTAGVGECRIAVQWDKAVASERQELVGLHGQDRHLRRGATAQATTTGAMAVIAQFVVGRMAAAVLGLEVGGNNLVRPVVGNLLVMGQRMDSTVPMVKLSTRRPTHHRCPAGHRHGEAQQQREQKSKRFHPTQSALVRRAEQVGGLGNRQTTIQLIDFTLFLIFQ